MHNHGMPQSCMAQPKPRHDPSTIQPRPNPSRPKPTKVNQRQSKPTKGNQRPPLPAKANQSRSKPIEANRSQSLPTKANQGRPKSTKDNHCHSQSQPKSTKANQNDHAFRRFRLDLYAFRGDLIHQNHL
eukprot:GEMP01136279.1.p2 GENE.GEMP01136279.1~~GEMP01136279.1.p2  ORF type:complete len:129 (+),score=8.63 GEMP01136279.1:97-483(+)